MKKTIRIDDLLTIEPITDKQRQSKQAFRDGDNVVMIGSAGTGKTFLTLYLALEQVMDKSNSYDKVVIIRSIVPTRDAGHLPGTIEEKLEPYAAPYKAAVTEMFNESLAYERLVDNGYLEFESTSYVRGISFNNAIVIVDEMQNLNFHELDSIITRIGRSSKIMFCGDIRQSDFRKNDDKKGVEQFLSILENLKNFSIISYGWEDIVRSGLVRDYIMTKEHMGL